jgi:hypothetical protein
MKEAINNNPRVKQMRDEGKDPLDREGQKEVFLTLGEYVVEANLILYALSTRHPNSGFDPILPDMPDIDADMATELNS